MDVTFHPGRHCDFGGGEDKKKSNTFLVDVASKETSHKAGDYGWLDGLKFIKPTKPKRNNRQYKFSPKTTASSGCSTVTGKACVFPFKYGLRGLTFNSCTLAGSYTRPWCSLKTDSRGNHMIGRRNWGYCQDSCTGTRYYC